MKISAFDPVIVSPDASSLIKLFEALGFETHHSPTNAIDGAEVTSTRMENAEGFHVDVVSTTTPRERDEMLIRMNVDDFDEAYALLTAQGFKNVKGDESIDLKSTKAVTMEAPTGFRISIVKHIKDPA